ncbi:hypothetical protein [Peribacillus muralis]|uniref:hypothetical protein n=1 Tax=Peribacillus muralis TaxID=264697 RepID=UPI003D02E222
MTMSNPGLFTSENQSNSQQQSKKKFKIHGFKFFQYALNRIRKEVYDYAELGYDKGLDASAVAIYVGLHSKCSSAGLLDADFHVSALSKELNIPTATGSNGINQLLDRGLIIERETDKKNQYEIVGYAANNLSREESINPDKKLNYLTVPFDLMQTTVLANLVSKKSPRGIILMLEILNTFRNKFRGAKACASEYKTDLKTDTLMEKLGKSSAKRVRDILEVLSPIFTFKPIDLKERKPRPDVITRVRTAVTQIWVRKYDIHIKLGCIIEKEAHNEETTKAYKDADYRIRLLKIPMFQKDRIGIRAAYKGSVKEIAQFVKNKKQQTKLHRDSMQHALEELEDFLRKGNKIKSVGAFINTKLQEYVIQFLDDHNLYIDIETFYHQTESPVPAIWEKYRTHKKAMLA